MCRNVQSLGDKLAKFDGCPRHYHAVYIVEEVDHAQQAKNSTTG